MVVAASILPSVLMLSLIISLVLILHLELILLTLLLIEKMVVMWHNMAYSLSRMETPCLAVP